MRPPIRSIEGINIRPFSQTALVPSNECSLSTPIQFVKRVGERIAQDLAKRGVLTVEDLLYHLPFRYEDRLNIKPIAELEANTMASVIGEVRGRRCLKRGRARSSRSRSARGRTR